MTQQVLGLHRQALFAEAHVHRLVKQLIKLGDKPGATRQCLCPFHGQPQALVCRRKPGDLAQQFAQFRAGRQLCGEPRQSPVALQGEQVLAAQQTDELVSVFGLNPVVVIHGKLADAVRKGYELVPIHPPPVLDRLQARQPLQRIRQFIGRRHGRAFDEYRQYHEPRRIQRQFDFTAYVVIDTVEAA